MQIATTQQGAEEIKQQFTQAIRKEHPEMDRHDSFASMAEPVSNYLMMASWFGYHRQADYRLPVIEAKASRRTTGSKPTGLAGWGPNMKMADKVMAIRYDKHRQEPPHFVWGRVLNYQNNNLAIRTVTGAKRFIFDSSRYVWQIQPLTSFPYFSR